MQPQNNNKKQGGNAYTFSPTILREYDIRGQIGKNLSEDDAYALGRAFGTFVANRCDSNERVKVCVGYDGRDSSPGLADALARGLMSTGARVKNVGLGPTPMLYFAVKDMMADAGIMVTGSHNPPDYNGFKMMLQSEPVFGEMIQEIGRLSASGNLKDGEGTSETLDITENYITRLLKDFEAQKHPMKIAWDAGNGAAGEIMKRLTDKLPGEHYLLYEDIDGNFPNHHPDPTVDKNLVDIIKVVKEKGCDMGIAFDGDGDRIGVVDEQGNVLRCDILLTLYARSIIEDMPKAPIVGDVKCSQSMFEEIARMGGTPVMWKTGHSLIKDKMKELNAPLGGELSGHIFFADKYYGFDDGLYCAIRLMNEVAERGKKLSELTSHLNNLHNTPEVRFEVDEDIKFDIVPKVYENLKPRESDDLKINDIDGIRVSTADGWWLLRPSNTQNVLVARAESNSAEGLERLKDMAITEVKKLGYSLDFSEG